MDRMKCNRPRREVKTGRECGSSENCVLNEVGAYGREICFKEMRCVVRKRSREEKVLDTKVSRRYGGGSDMSVM